MLLIVLLSGCFDKVDPNVNTLYVENGDITTQRLEAVSTLYQHYTDRKMDREAYEVISKKSRFILNFTPGLELLTVCGDPGSGWARQYQNFDEVMLKKLVDEKISFNDLYGTGTMTTKIDSMLTRKKPIYNVNTNGSPI